MNRNSIVKQFRYTNPFTGKVEYEDMDKHMMPHRDYEAEERDCHFWTIRYSNVSDPELCEDSLHP